MRDPLVVAGALLVAAVGCALFYDPVGWVWTAAVLAVITLGVGWPWLIVRVCGVEIRMGTPVVDLGSPVDVELTRTGPSWLSSQPVTVLLGGLAHQLTSARSVVQVVPSERGRFPAGSVLLACDAPFGLFRATRVASVRSSTVVLPVGPAVRVPVSRSQISDHARVRTTAPSGGETMGLREYRRGDPPRQIHWAATARLDKLIARERLDTSRPIVTLWFDASSFAGAPVGPESSFERAIALTAGMIRSWTQGAACVELVMPGRSFQINWLPDLRIALEALALLPADASFIERVAMRGARPDVLVTAGDEAQGRAGRVFRFNRGTMSASELAEMVRASDRRGVAHA